MDRNKSSQAVQLLVAFLFDFLLVRRGAFETAVCAGTHTGAVVRVVSQLLFAAACSVAVLMGPR